ncbi:hypothetical protein AMAG_16366 [Allomyces macrogynus ATCC 38327]|uniref:Uncharacterized protein n=1 Tax=Allomyces macrogynus (strain ATCC 38327) TaxID=578462 RepID=A0A0L0TAW3_ALLM3|nr:hypothetical protein AMAG_16366 [Allomyces macrogynus ATCC 38327]|eukprot:KNE71943.1 hypothetical protein AMAG_16366 [Allomyces macrogynus ATCC 38327]
MRSLPSNQIRGRRSPKRARSGPRPRSTGMTGMFRPGPAHGPAVAQRDPGAPAANLGGAARHAPGRVHWWVFLHGLAQPVPAVAENRDYPVLSETPSPCTRRPAPFVSCSSARRGHVGAGGRDAESAPARRGPDPADSKGVADGPGWECRDVRQVEAQYDGGYRARRLCQVQFARRAPDARAWRRGHEPAAETVPARH